MGEYCGDNTVLMRRQVKVLHLQHVLKMSSGNVLIVQDNISTSPPVVRIVPFDAGLSQSIES